MRYEKDVERPKYWQVKFQYPHKDNLMQAYELVIDTKTKTSPFGIVSAEDFQVHTGQQLDPHIILEQSNISLYCLDHANQRVLFVETSPEVDLLRAPFYFIVQYEAAQRLIAVPYDALYA